MTASSGLQLNYINVDDIRVKADSDLRNVNLEHPSYQQIVKTLNEGYPILNPINVIPDPENPGKYLLVDGKHRLTAAKQSERYLKDYNKTIPAQVLDMVADDIHFAQIIGNMAKVETSQVQYARQLRRILAHPKYTGMSLAEVCSRLGLKESLSSIRNLLKLGELLPEAEQAVEEGKINLSYAYVLAELPMEEQLHFMERATSTDPNFIADVQRRKAELKAIAKGENPEKIDPLKLAKTRKLGDIKEKFEAVENDIATAPDEMSKQWRMGYYTALSWVMQIDEETKAAKQAEKDRKQAERELIVENRKKLQQQSQEAQKNQSKPTDEEIKARIEQNKQSANQVQEMVNNG